MNEKTLERWIRQSGWIILLAYAALVPLSYGLAPVTPRGAEQPEEERMLRSLVDGIPALSDGAHSALRSFVSGLPSLNDGYVRAALFLGPLLIVTIAALIVLFGLRNRATAPDEKTVRSLYRWSIAFGLANVFSYPIMTQDFWLSVIWGRLASSGLNPYYVVFPQSLLSGLPIVESGERMTYGPLWAWMSSAVALITQRSVILEFLVFKGLLIGAWFGALVLLRKITRDVAPQREGEAVWLLGWLPISLRMTVGEAHNDIILIVLLLLWFYLIVRGRTYLAPAALAASVLVKYITAPLFALELWRARALTPRKRLWYAASLVAIALVCAGLFLPFAEDVHMLDPMTRMRDWTFWTPAMAIVHAAAAMGIVIPERIASAVVLGSCGLLLLSTLADYAREDTLDHFAAVVLASLTTILLGVVGHVWPWFIVWVVPMCVLVRRPLLVTFLLALAVQAPFLNWEWLVGGGPPMRRLAGILLYANATLAVGVVLVYRRAAAARAAKTSGVVVASSQTDTARMLTQEGS